MEDREFEILAQILEDYHADRIAGRPTTIDQYIRKYAVEGELKAEITRYLEAEEWMTEAFKPITSRQLPDGFLESVKEGLDSSINKLEKENFIKDKDKGVIHLPKGIKLAAEDKSRQEQIKSRLMHEFANKSIIFGEYSGSFLYADINLASLVFRKNKVITSELDSCKVDIYIENEEKDTLQIQNGSVTVNFSGLGISMQNYGEIRLVIRKGAHIIGEGRIK